MSDDNSILVFTTDPSRNKRCERCRQLQEACTCPPEETVPDEIRARLAVEKAGRQGKTVTLIYGLPKNESYLKNLSKQLKNRCGSGGTYKLAPEGGMIEIQGDHRSSLPAILKKFKIIVD